MATTKRKETPAPEFQAHPGLPCINHRCTREDTRMRWNDHYSNICQTCYDARNQKISRRRLWDGVAAEVKEGE